MEDFSSRDEAQAGTFSMLKKDKALLSIFIILVLLGIAVRVIYPTEPGIWNDDMSTLPTGLLWFYPHDSYPGLSGQGEPALGNLFFGAGCMLSGQDFSNVTKIRPMWYPDRGMLLGKQLAEAEDFCRIPSYLFGLIFFLGIILFALAMLDKYSALFFIAFFAFYQHILQFSRWIHVDIIAYAFIIFGLLFLWKSYSSQKYSGAELYYFIACMVMFSLAFATKLPNVVYAVFAFAILLLKYKEELYALLIKAGKYIDLKLGGSHAEADINLRKMTIMLSAGALAYLLALLPSFEFSLKNIFSVISKYRATDAIQGASIGNLAFNKNIWAAVHNFLLSLNMYDIAVLSLSIYAAVHIAIASLRKKQKKEIFSFMLFALFACMLLIFPAMDLIRVSVSFVFGVALCMALVFSETENSPFGFLKISHGKKRLLLISLLILYIAYAGFNAFSDSPYNEYRNSLICNGNECNIPYHAFAETRTGLFMQELLNDTSQTFDLNGIVSLVYYYARPEEAEPILFWRESFRQQVGRMPTAEERVNIFKPLNRTIRYLLVGANRHYDDDYVNYLKQTFEPNDRITLLHNHDAVWIYDLRNLRPIVL